MAKHVPPGVTTAAGYVESEVSSWIHARIKGERWTPGPIPEHPRIIRKREAQDRTGLSNFTLWTMEQRGEFPPRLRLTEVRVGPRSDDSAKPRKAPAAAPEDVSADEPHKPALVRRAPVPAAVG
jgi:predicted DNA-binding transcriptional regulator AlpA